MDPSIRPQVSRPPSTSIPPQGPPPLSNLQYQMQPHYNVPQPHTLPPLQHPQSHSPTPHTYLNQQQPYRHDIPRYPPTTANDVYTTSSAPMSHHAPVNGLPPSSFLTHHHGQQPYPHAMVPPATTAQAYPQPIAPAPPRDRIPPAPYSHAENKGPLWTSADGLSTPAFVPKEPPRTQVVGSQGRRGILPSVPGRPPAVTNGVNGTTKNTTIPAKDADGKFPCPHCNKTYLHAKHLKRHLLRHTGDRPYMCVLCKDTFSRSDILKRHFQKCSLRRGNPTGISHLSHPHAHLKKAQAAGVVPKPLQGDLNVDLPPIDAAKTQAVTDAKRPVLPTGPHPSHPGDIDWSSMFSGGGHDGYMNPVFPSSVGPVPESMQPQVEPDRKFYPPASSGGAQEGGLNGIYLGSTSLAGEGTVQPARQ